VALTVPHYTYTIIQFNHILLDEKINTIIEYMVLVLYMHEIEPKTAMSNEMHQQDLTETKPIGSNNI
jgi:hypothetical protein